MKKYEVPEVIVVEIEDVTTDTILSTDTILPED